MTLNVALKSCIFASGRTQRAVAVDARIPEQKLSAAMRGRAELTKREKQRLAKSLNTTVDHLFGEEAEATA